MHNFYLLLIRLIIVSCFIASPVFGQSTDPSDYQTSQQEQQEQQQFQRAVNQFKQEVIRLDNQTQTELGAKLNALGIPQTIPVISWIGTQMPVDTRISLPPKEITSSPPPQENSSNSNTNTSSSPGLNMYQQ